MKQRWIAAAAQLPQSATEAGAQQKVTALTDLLGLEVKYLNTRDYPRLRFGSTTPPATPTEPLFLVYVGGPFLTQVDAEKQCALVGKHTNEPCLAVQPDPPQ
jgi:hypothetical protein